MPATLASRPAATIFHRSRSLYLCTRVKLAQQGPSRLLEGVEDQRQRTGGVAQVEDLLEQEEAMRARVRADGRHGVADGLLCDLRCHGASYRCL